jgi:Tol biopolymer transport system component
MILLAVLPGCGRINFDPLRSGDAAIDATPRCTPQAPFTTITRVDAIATGNVDGGARLNADETTIYFHSDRSGQYRILQATRASRDLPFGMATDALPSGDGLWPTVSRDELTLVYSTVDLFASTRGSVSEAFPPAALLTSLNTSNGETNPFLGALGTTLYFTTYEPDGTFYAAAWPAAASAQPIAELNTSGREEGPAVSDDERVIYFARDTGNGPEVYYAERDSATSSFGPAVAVAELAAPGNNKPTWLSPDLCRLYFETTRSGNYDIYVAERTP